MTDGLILVKWVDWSFRPGRPSPGPHICIMPMEVSHMNWIANLELFAPQERELKSHFDNGVLRELVDKLSATEYSPKKTIRAASSTPTLNNWQSLSTTMADAVSPATSIPWPNTRDEYTMADVIGKNLFESINQFLFSPFTGIHSHSKLLNCRCFALSCLWQSTQLIPNLPNLHFERQTCHSNVMTNRIWLNNIHTTLE